MVSQGVKWTRNASERLKVEGEADGSLYQNWKFQAVPGSIRPGPAEAGD